MSDSEIARIDSVSLSLTDMRWAFAGGRARDIADYWRGLVERSPTIWNGDVLLACDWTVRDHHLTASLLKTDYASFVAWRDWGWPDTSVFDLYGSAVIRASDGALIFGEMANHTMNAGLVYPPGGSLDMSDVREGGKVDVAGSIVREMFEETGLNASEAAEGACHIVPDGQRLSVAQEFRFCESAESLVRKTSSWISTQEHAELAQTVIIRDAATARLECMPGFAQALVRHLLPLLREGS